MVISFSSSSPWVSTDFLSYGHQAYGGGGLETSTSPVTWELAGGLTPKGLYFVDEKIRAPSS